MFTALEVSKHLNDIFPKTCINCIYVSGETQAEGENVDKLEKADILEFTVKHLQKITRRDPVEEAYKFQVSLNAITFIRSSLITESCYYRPL